MNFLKLFSCLLLVFFFSSCSSDPYEKYIGVWEGHEKSRWDNSDTIKILEITKQGESYLVRENILIESEPMLLSKNDGQLIVNTGIGTIPIAFGEDKNILLVANGSFKRISPERVNEIKDDIKKKKEEKIKKEALCKEIIQEMKEEIEKIRKNENINSEKNVNLGKRPKANTKKKQKIKNAA